MIPGSEEWDNYSGRIELCIIEGALVITHADPRITITAALLDAIRNNRLPHATCEGEVLRIEASNRTVVYRIGAEVPTMFAYYAEWPD